MENAKRNHQLSIALIIVCLLASCAPQQVAPVNPYPVPPANNITLESFLSAANNRNFVTNPEFRLQDAKYFDQVNQAFKLTPDELTLLRKNGFVISDRLLFEDFTHAYGWIYWKDLPVLITTDSMLQAVHETYSDLLMRIEEKAISPLVVDMLSRTRRQLRAISGKDAALKTLQDDLDVYLATALAALTESEPDIPAARSYLDRVNAADNVYSVRLFGSERDIDFTRFKPTGHYTASRELANYFRAMMWLALIDFRFVDYDPDGRAILKTDQIAAAVLLRNAMDAAKTREAWMKVDSLFGMLFGRSDNTTLPDLDHFVADVGISQPEEFLQNAKREQILALLTTKDYGQQRITGQLLKVNPANTKPLPRPVSFLLLGQRFTVDSYLMSNLVFDRLMVDGNKAKRPYPSPLDVMYILGNDRAATHLRSELTKYSYQGSLDALRKSVGAYDSTFWTGNAYNYWLRMLRALNDDTTAAKYPQVMRATAWTDKMLHTQLASWAQLRHDTLLYVKETYTMRPVCQYPAGYVEPYPAFYAALKDYAQAGRAVLEHIDLAGLGEEVQKLMERALGYLDHLKEVASRLQAMAEKELRLEPFNTEEEAFIRDTAIQQQLGSWYPQTPGKWTGWYPKLFPWDDTTPAVVADIHTNAAELLPPVGVLHVATGRVVANIFIANTDEGMAVYVGPAFTYYEFVEEGFPPKRLNDEEWQQRLATVPRPKPPAWTANFRLPDVNNSQVLMPGLGRQSSGQ